MNERLGDPPHVSAIRPPKPERGSFAEACAFVIQFSEWQGMTLADIGEYHRGLSFLRWLLVMKERQSSLIGMTPSANDRAVRAALRVYLAHPTIQARKPMRVPKPKA